MSEEKTRIVPRSEPKLAADAITFKCANGHRIVVPAKLAGKRGTCSKCGIALVIPATSPAVGAREPKPEAGPEEASASPLPGAVPEETPVMPEQEPATEPPNAFADLFNAVSASQSRAGDDTAATPSDDGPQDFGDQIEEAPGGSAIGDVLANEAGQGAAEPYEIAVAADNPTAQLVARLWVERAHGGIVEIHIAGGGVILPEWYEPQWSRGTHGLFASQAADGSVTLTAVAWDSIQKIVVRQVEGLPDGMFE
ncbi:MAG: hypothetical protein WCH77_06755 [Planctomycetota bacterium]